MCERPLKPVGRFTHNTIKLYKLRGVLIGRIALAKQNARQCLQYSRLTGITQTAHSLVNDELKIRLVKSSSCILN